MISNELFAIDGCKMPSDASKEWLGTLEELEQERGKIKKPIRYHMDEQQKKDREPEGNEERIDRVKQSIETLNASYDKLSNFLAMADKRMGKGKRPTEVKSNITDNESAKMKTNKGMIQGYNGIAAVDKKHQIIVDAQAFGEGQEHHTHHRKYSRTIQTARNQMRTSVTMK